MPIYEYAYFPQGGGRKVVERMFRMSDRPDTIEVLDEDGETYTAYFRISTPAGGHSTWAPTGESHGLPPENWNPNDG